MVEKLRSIQWRLYVVDLLESHFFSLLTELGIKGWSLKWAVKNMVESV